jgi:ABC-type multidrug transport system fused ATPase/permease subunit
MIRTILQFRGFLRPYRLRLVAGSVSTLLGTLLALAQPWPLKVIIDSVIHHHRLRLPGTSFLDGAAPNTILDFAIGAFLLIVVLNAFLDYFANAMASTQPLTSASCSSLGCSDSRSASTRRNRPAIWSYAGSAT